MEDCCGSSRGRTTVVVIGKDCGDCRRQRMAVTIRGKRLRCKSHVKDCGSGTRKLRTAAVVGQPH